MSVTIANSISSAIMAIAVLFIVKIINKSSINLYSKKNLLLLLCLIVMPIFVHNKEYASIYTIIIYTLLIITYKYILNISFTRSVLSCGIIIILIILLEIIGSYILVPFISAEKIRNTWNISIFSNLIYLIILFLIFYKTKFGNWISEFISKIENKKHTRIIVFIILVIIAMSIILYSLTQNFKLNSIFKRNSLIFIIFFLLVIILFSERNSYEKLSSEYDNLFNYVKVFEDWIETEQFIRHEYKNQLAVLRCMTKEKKVKDKIDSIISESINIDNQIINELKDLPNGGLKGLLYYKIIVARNQKINISIDVSKGVSKVLNKLNDYEIKVLSKLIGVYCDNAIEAANETKKKIVSIEIYEYDGIARLVISNSYNKNQDITRRNEKGFSTKGTNRGNGLYFSKKLLSKNKWIEEEQKTIDNFYIVKLIIRNKKISK